MPKFNISRLTRRTATDWDLELGHWDLIGIWGLGIWSFYGSMLAALALLLLTGCSGFDVINAMSPAWGYRRTNDLAYGTLPRQRLDLYQPTNKSPSAGIVIFFYGGYWQYGEKGDYRFVADALTSQGYTAILPNYRVYPQTVFPGFVQDGALVVRWAHDHAKQIGSDPQHIYLMGHSAGAHIAALLTLDGHYLKQVGLDRSDIRATVGLSGPYDLKIGKELRPVFGASSASTQPIDPAVQPINFVDGREPPMLLINGTADTTVEPGNAVRLAARIRSAGGLVQVILYKGWDHSSIVGAFAFEFRWFAPPVLRDSVDFLRKH
jgi:acetyl esterase/lipase